METVNKHIQEETKKKGYRVAKGVGVDMFPFTEHCEAVTLLTRQKK